MTRAQASNVFKLSMQAMRQGKKLTAYDKERFHKAQAVLRASRKPAMNAHKKKYDITRDNKNRWYVVELKTGKVVDGPRTESDAAKALLAWEHSASQKNPGKRKTLIYAQVDKIYATKKQNHICDAECKAHGHRYYHTFSSKPKMYGLPNGDLLITSRK